MKIIEAQDAINALYQDLLSKGIPIPGNIREVFHEHMNRLTGRKKRPAMITVEQLKASGWEITEDPIIPAKKKLGETEDTGTLDLVVHRYSNVAMFALSLPDGAMVNINPRTIEELNAFEKMIMSYEPNF